MEKRIFNSLFREYSFCSLAGMVSLKLSATSVMLPIWEMMSLADSPCRVRKAISAASCFFISFFLDLLHRILRVMAFTYCVSFIDKLPFHDSCYPAGNALPDSLDFVKRPAAVICDEIIFSCSLFSLRFTPLAGD